MDTAVFAYPVRPLDCVRRQLWLGPLDMEMTQIRPYHLQDSTQSLPAVSTLVLVQLQSSQSTDVIDLHLNRRLFPTFRIASTVNFFCLGID
ncbi:hypothetical protein Cob_v003463 [Colletotrichum orbiculare MAFF 240422]|uniref:Uncharacterized protein n=1 Tax=Colletotrichum orbiculare (strain 104-T / ATCC 96160 / CBS 514.97 / LARS 414 / MAFF 240422) TaxID=1213857 RepID=A0A484G1R8_COLOR|nr:hypothetical protein Cob_v003463 [Colletotrichum orbiculare MAFF 240422]